MNVKTLIILGLIAGINSTIYAQKDSTIHSVPFYWTFELGSSYLTSSSTIKNQAAPFLPTASGSFYFNWNLPLGNQLTVPMSGLFLAPGIGIGVSTFSINKNLSETDGQITIEDIDGSYEYSYVQGIYFDVPIDFRYLTKPDLKRQSFSFELGGKFGYLVDTEKEIQKIDGNNTNTYNSKHSGILNKYRYGINAKIGFRKMKINRGNDLMGLSFSVIGNYYFSEAFIDHNSINCKSFSIGAGLGFNFK
ncbi:MAG: hypothetical protein ACOYMA_20550 [Bacteroidia bacterium]